ncbi:MAG: adaptor protein MecA [Clostridia bacterium]|nr:adaptor protein MecA [Clostridia bacterium]
MKIEKITDNKIRIILNLEELSNNNINISDFINNDPKTQKFFLDILNKAEKDFGFYTKDCKLLIEAFSSLDEVYVFTITKFSPKKKKTTLKLKRQKHKSFSSYAVYKFDSFDEFCNLCELVDNSNLPITNICKKISLYSYNNTYYLVFSKLNLSYRNFKKLFSIISEFATAVSKPSHFEAKILEFGKPIIKQNALKTGIKYFI